MRNTEYLKVPVDMAKFALSGHSVSQLSTYLASHFLYSGKSRVDARPHKEISSFSGASTSTVYRHFDWHLARNWFGKDQKNGWYYFRGIDKVQEIEGWKFKRSAVLYPTDLKHLKAFLAGAFISSMARSSKSGRAGRVPKGALPASRPTISISAIANTLNVSTKTAYRLRKLADAHNYINSQENLTRVTSLTPQDLKHLRHQDYTRISVALFGRPGDLSVDLGQFRCIEGQVFFQGPNFIESLMVMKAR